MNTEITATYTAFDASLIVTFDIAMSWPLAALISNLDKALAKQSTRCDAYHAGSYSPTDTYRVRDIRAMSLALKVRLLTTPAKVKALLH